jgi:hypothetical protein
VARLPVPRNVALKSHVDFKSLADFKLIGTPAKRLSTRPPNKPSRLTSET